MPKIIITLPAYRAEHTLGKTIADIPEGVADELILVDDASPDNTAQLARELGITVHVHPENRGYGGNQKTCYSEALREGADIVVMLHPDYQYDPKAVPLLIAPLLSGDAEVTFGSRFAGMNDPREGGMPWYRYYGNRVTTMLENLMLGTRFTEMHSGMRAYTRHALLALPFLRYSDDFDFDSQLMVDAVTSGLRVVEVPIPTRYTKESSSISVIRSLRYVWRSLHYCATRVAVSGRRGRRSPVLGRGRARWLGGAQRVERTCVACGGTDQRLVYRATATDELPMSDFRCTTDALSKHDDIVQCARCRLVAAVPEMATTEIADRYAEVVDPEYFAEEAGRRELFAWVARQIGGYHTPGLRLFEIGSNVGMFLDEARRAGWAAAGIEPSRWAVEEGKARFGVDLRMGKIEDLSLPPASIDAVVLFDVLEHLGDPMDALNRLRSVVADEGVLAVSTVNIDSVHGKLRGERWPWLVRSHLFYFSPPTLEEMLTRAGFRLVEWTTVPRSFRVSYLAHRLSGSHPAVARAFDLSARTGLDPALPLGWLGDVTLAIARPVVREG